MSYSMNTKDIYLVSLFENFLSLTLPNSIFSLSVTNLAKSLCELPLNILMLGILAQKILFSVVSILIYYSSSWPSDHNSASTSNRKSDVVKNMQALFLYGFVYQVDFQTKL